MKQLVNLIILVIIAVIIYWFAREKFQQKDTTVSNHSILIEQIESIGKLELVKYRVSDVMEHINKNQYLPNASVLLIIKADAVGCIDLSKLKPEDVYVHGDTALITLPQPEICYVKIDHAASKVYDTKMAFFQEANLVDEAYKYAESEIYKQVTKSDILQQTKVNAQHVLKPLIIGLGYANVVIEFK